MRITGTRNFIQFDLENGYVAKAEGEMLIGKKFVVYKDTIKFGETPHEKEEITSNQILEIINEVQRNTNKNTVQIIFE